MFRRASLSLFLVLGSLIARAPNRGDSTYAGPISIGPFRIDEKMDVRQMFRRVGEPASLKSNHFCYSSTDRTAFLWFDKMAHQPDRVGDLLLSDFPNCVDRPGQMTTKPIASWKTEAGIGLKSQEAAVLKAYGSPTKTDTIDRSGYRWVIQGDSSTGDQPERGDKVLIYSGAHTLDTAEFGIRNGLVAWIFLSINE